MDLIKLDDDNLISILAHLDPSDIISIRKTCKRLHLLTHARIVWTHACMRCISLRYPFPRTPLESMSILDLEKSSRNAHRLGQKWLTSSFLENPRFIREVPDISSAAITDVRFVPGHGDKWILTISNSVWSVLQLWDINDLCSSVNHRRPLKSAKWSPKGGVFRSFCMNADPTSIATFAIGLLHQKTDVVYIISVVETEGEVEFETVKNYSTDFSPIGLDGDLIAFRNAESKVLISDWRTGEQAMLTIRRDDQQIQYGLGGNFCTQVLFSRSSDLILVIRQNSIHLFPFPELRSEEQGPLTYTETVRHHFGRIAGIAVTLTDPPLGSLGPSPISIVVRQKGTNPFSFDLHCIEYYTILPDPMYERYMSPHRSPYIFPPVLQSRRSNLGGTLSDVLQRTHIALGRNGTAVWISPRDRAAVGLFSGDIYAAHWMSPRGAVSHQHDERLMGTAFQGPLLADDGGILKGTILSNDDNNWTSMAYDEDLGRIVVGSSSGNLTVILL